MNRNVLVWSVVLGFSVWVPCADAQTPPPPSTPRKIAWAETPKLAIREAKAAQRPILAFVTADRCGFCRKMDRTTWNDVRIIQQVEKQLVPMKLHAVEHRALVERLKVKALPTTILFTPTGQVITGAVGFLPPEQMTKLMQAARPVTTASRERP